MLSEASVKLNSADLSYTMTNGKKMNFYYYRRCYCCCLIDLNIQQVWPTGILVSLKSKLFHWFRVLRSGWFPVTSDPTQSSVLKKFSTFFSSHCKFFYFYKCSLKYFAISHLRSITQNLKSLHYAKWSSISLLNFN